MTDLEKYYVLSQEMIDGMLHLRKEGLLKEVIAMFYKQYRENTVFFIKKREAGKYPYNKR